MFPLRVYRSISERYSDFSEIEPYKKFILVLEGQVSETEYFESLKSKKKEVGIHNLVEIVNLERTETDVGRSNPKALLELLKEMKSELDDSDEPNPIDEFVMIFDIDIFRGKPDELCRFVSSAESECSLFATSPGFELWLLLHKEDSLEKIIRPNEKSVFENKRVSNQHRFIGKKLSEEFYGFNSKTRSGFTKLIENVDFAIEQEKFLQQDITKMHQEIGSSIGILIEKMKNDPRIE